MKTILFNVYKFLKNHYLSKKIRYHYYRLHYQYFDKVTVRQNKAYTTIPIIIINYNQLFYLKQLIDFLQRTQYSNLVIIDNNSSYPPLLDYYDEIEHEVTIHRLKENIGHMVFWKKKELFEKYSKGYYVVTDADIVPVEDCPEDFVLQFKKILDKTRGLSKVGFSLKIDDIPETNPNKNKVVDWEMRFWKDTTPNGNYKASIDTTFAIYPPKKIWSFRKHFYHAIRTAPPYTARHGGWYLDMDHLTEEQLFYMNSANSSSSWNINHKGHLSNDVCY